jgi:uncharacterized protein (DUF433 family)
MVVALDRHIEATADTCGGKPRIAGTRITVMDIAILHLRLDQPLDVIAAKFDLPLSSVYAAIAFYYDHRVEMEQAIHDDEALAETLRSQFPSPLEEKLRKLKRA